MREESNKKSKVFPCFQFSLGCASLFRLLCFFIDRALWDFCLFIHAQLSWSKSLVRKWFNIKTKAQDFHADCDAAQGNATLGMFAEWNFRHPALDVSRITRFSGLVPRFHSEKDTLPANMSRSDTATFSLCSWYWSLECPNQTPFPQVMQMFVCCCLEFLYLSRLMACLPA